VVRRILVIDDLANRKHDCDLLLDQNFYCDGEYRYDGLLPSNCQTFLGPAYVMLRDEFYELKKHVRHRDGRIRHVMCFYGASDPTAETLKAMMALQAPGMEAVTVDVVVGEANPQRERIAELCEKLRGFSFHCQTSRMAELCARADLALGAGGSANWERAFLGLPSLVTITADNQAETTRAMASAGGVWLLGGAGCVTDASIMAALREAMASPARLQSLSRAALSIMDSGELYGPQALIKAMLD
jgi:UDP-2,4-diacetamido-2,4,6-trideoxy-beta-L-altropyranose hydrolase